MFGPLPKLSEKDLPDFEAYQQRCLSVVANFAPLHGLNSAAETARFIRCQKRLSPPLPLANSANMVQHIAQSVPLMFEFVVATTQHAVVNFGYMTQGRTGGTLSESLANQLARGLEFYLHEGGTSANAQCLAELFGLSFTDLLALDHYSPMAQGLLLGFASTAYGMQMKAYFNTRLDPSEPHRNKLQKIFDHLHLESHLVDNVFSQLFENQLAQFYGLGVDLAHTGETRTKLYLRTERKLFESALTGSEEILPHLRSQLAQPFSAWVEKFPQKYLADDIELVFVLRPGVAPQFKVTLFFVDALDKSFAEALATNLSNWGFAPDLLKNILYCGDEQKNHRGTHLHGLSVEAPLVDCQKFNFYLLPATSRRDPNDAGASY